MEEKILSAVQAGYPFIWLETSEPHRAQNELSEMFIQKGIIPYTWDIETGGYNIVDSEQFADADPLEAIKSFVGLQMNDKDNKAVLFLWNYHHFIKSPEISQAILSYTPSLQKDGKTVIILSPVVDIPKEVEKLFVVETFSLPTESKLKEYLDSFLRSKSITASEREKTALIKAGMGLTKFEFLSALSMSLVTKGKLDVKDILDQKNQLIRKNRVLELFKPADTDKFAYIGGLENLKEFLLKTIGSPLARGVLLLGVPGTGKSAIAKALGNEVGLPVISLDFGKAFGSLVGESESRIREALKIVDAMSPCILFIDEIEKGLAGIASSHMTDGGTGSRVFGNFLTWLNDHKSQVYVIATSNDISKLPPEFLRAERWDAIFFVDLPNANERKSIWKIWLNFYELPKNSKLPNDEGWTGAEIKTACRLAKMLNVTPLEASEYIVPIYKSMGTKIKGLRSWASTRCVPASKPMPAPAKKRKVVSTGGSFV